MRRDHEVGDTFDLPVRIAALLIAAPFLAAQSPNPAPPPASHADAAKPAEPPPAPVVTHHEIRLAGNPLKYTVTTGLMPLKNATGEIEANIFFIAYTAGNAGLPSRRPLMFSFNGGPGSSSVWLHLGALGPRRVKMLDEGQMPAPPVSIGG